MVVVRVWSVPAVQQTHEAAYRAGEHHGADDDPLHLDACIAGSSLAFTHHGNLVAVLAVIEVDVHEYGEHRHHKDHQQVFLAADHRQPASLRALVDDADLTSHTMMKKAASWVAM